MLTENGLDIDPEALEQVLNRADVLAIGFTMFPERLLIDTRARPDEGPLVAIVSPVASVQERYLWLGQHRGRFGAPQAFSFFTWPQTVRSMVERDALAPLRRRLADSSSDGAELLDRILARLLEAEAEAFRAAVRGEAPWQSLWQRAA